MEKICMRFTFNRRARLIALSAIKKLEDGAFASSILGAFSANPKVSAITALILFVACRIGETLIAGIEDDPSSDLKNAKKLEAPALKEDAEDSG